MCLGKGEKYLELNNSDKVNRLERLKILNELEIVHDGVMDALDSFTGKKHNSIDKSDLENFPVLKWVELNEDVKIRRRSSLFNDTLVFDTTVKKGGKFGVHFHEDCIEHCDIIKGELTDLMTGVTKYEGDVFIFEKGVNHIPISKTDTILKVYFR